MKNIVSILVAIAALAAVAAGAYLLVKKYCLFERCCEDDEAYFRCDCGCMDDEDAPCDCGCTDKNMPAENAENNENAAQE